MPVARTVKLPASLRALMLAVETCSSQRTARRWINDSKSVSRLADYAYSAAADRLNLTPKRGRRDNANR